MRKLQVVLMGSCLSNPGYTISQSHNASNKKNDAPKLTDYTGRGQKLFEWRQGIRFPVVASFDVGGKKLHFFAVRHGSGEDHPTLIRVKSLIEELKPDCVILEGFDNTSDSIRNVTEYVGSDINLKTASEPMYAAYLASKRSIPFIGGEPTNLEIQERLHSQYTEEDFVFYNFINHIPSAVRKGIKFNAVLEYCQWYWQDQASGPDHEKKLNDWFVRKMGQLPTLCMLKDSEFSAPKKQGHFIQRMSHHIDEIRNWNILNTIDDSLKKHSNVLVIYGCSHYFQQFKVLQKKYGAPTYDTKTSLLGNCGIM